MRICVITIAGREYVHDTVRQILDTNDRKDMVHLMVGSPHDNYVENWRPHEQVTIRTMPRSRWRVIADRAGGYRASVNFLRALDFGDGEPAPHVTTWPTMLFEDDIELKPGWRHALEKIRMDVPRAADTLISLYAPEPRLEDVPGCGYGTLGKPVWFYGTLGVYVPAKHVRPLANYVRHKIEVAEYPSFDNLLRAYVSESDADLVVSVPSYVDHRGDYSAIRENQGQGPRKAPMF